MKSVCFSDYKAAAAAWITQNSDGKGKRRFFSPRYSFTPRPTQQSIHNDSLAARWEKRPKLLFPLVSKLYFHAHLIFLHKTLQKKTSCVLIIKRHNKRKILDSVNVKSVCSCTWQHVKTLCKLVKRWQGLKKWWAKKIQRPKNIEAIV